MEARCRGERSAETPPSRKKLLADAPNKLSVHTGGTLVSFCARFHQVLQNQPYLHNELWA